MKKNLAKLISVLMTAVIFSVAAFSQTTEFAYQGQLRNSSAPANGSFDFEFLLFDTLAGPTQIGSTLTRNGVTVANGAFNVNLDFGLNFPGAPRFLEIHVRQNGGGAFTPLTPRNAILNTPYAVKSLAADNASQLGGLAANTYLQTTGNGSALTNLNGANITNNSINASALASDTFPNNQNLLRLGSLRWDLLGQRVSVGSNPQFDAFDGANIWVANQASNGVTKVRVSDGSVQGTFPVGTSPAGVAFDGANIWVANNGSNNVTKLRASDGAPQGTFAVGTAPFGVAFDGANIWVVNNGSNNVTKLRASDGSFQGTFSVDSSPRGVAFDGTNIWVANNGGTARVTRLRASDGACVAPCAFVVGTGANPYGIAFDGANMWITTTISGGSPSAFVSKLRVTDGVNLGNFSAGSNPLQVAFDGTNIWAAGSGGTVAKLRASDGALLATYAGGGASFGIAFDGANMWVTNQTGNSIVKLPVFP